MPNNSQGKKQQVEDHRRNFKFSNNKTSVTACNDSLNAKTSNVNFVCVTCGKCVINDNHDMCVLHYINGMNSRTKQPIVVPISTRKPKRTVNQSVETPLKRTVATESTIKKPRSIIRNLYEQVSKTCSWWYPKFTPSGYNWKPKSPIGNVNTNVSMPLGNASRTANILEPMTPRCSTLSDTPLSSNSFAARRDNSIHRRLWVLKAHDGKSQAPRVYYVEGLNHNLFSVGQFCDVVLEVAFRKSTCYVRNLKGNDLLTATSSQAWLWHRRLSHLNFDSINLLSKNDIMIGLPKLKFIKYHLCSSYLFKEDFLLNNCHNIFTQNRSLVIPRREKTPYHIINGRKPSVKFFHIFGSLCYIVRDGENLDKIKEKGDACIFVGYSTTSRGYRVYNMRTRLIVETIHVNFDELPLMASNHVSSDPVPQCLTTTLEHESLSLGPQSQENVPQATETVTTSNELDLLFSPMFDELLNGTTTVVSKSSAIHAADGPDKRQQQNTTQSTTTTVATDIPLLNIQTTPKTTNQAPTQAATVTSTENINQAETQGENPQVKEDEFINIFSTPVQE
ncbi:retrovirus-related pol polyprotein from transposon TNT 1-94 [Tanacetum coccineum]